MSTSLELKIPQWNNEDKPREKLERLGVKNLSDAELIAILLGSGSKGESAVSLAQRILAQVELKLPALAKMNIAELARFKGMGTAKAISILAALEIGSRTQLAPNENLPKITTSREAFDAMFSVFQHLPHEEFWILLLNRNNRIIRKVCISKGGIHGTVADPKLIFKAALDHLASGIILYHNHPSGNTKPSEADVQLTKNLTEAGRWLEISVLDHLIIAEGAYFSFADDRVL